MGITLSHLSALDALRTLRSEGVDLRSAEPVALRSPSSWQSGRWQASTFDSPLWRWDKPSQNNHLHVLVPDRAHRIRMGHVESHAQLRGMPAGSVLWLDECTSIVCPELLFLQMAGTFSLPALVLLGYELCGFFSRDAHEPVESNVRMELPAVTSVEKLTRYLMAFKRVPGIARARTALQYVADHAASAPEALLACMYSLPANESGYGMGPVTLNVRVDTDDLAGVSAKKHRYPDIMFSFAPVGINYDGMGHLDLDGLVVAAQRATLAEGGEREQLVLALDQKKREVRAKVIDDIVRNRQLVAHGKIVLPVTAEDLYGWGNLDAFTHHLLAVAQSCFGVDTSAFARTIDDTEKMRDRYVLLSSFLPAGRSWSSSHGRV